LKVLNKKQIQQKIARIAMEILEQNYTKKELVLAGINNAGTHFAGMLKKEIERVSEVEVFLTNIHLSPAKPVLNEITIDFPKKELKL
jgi:pyrimidine operon attenuation protein/uracil phosphoribosyltransferase